VRLETTNCSNQPLVIDLEIYQMQANIHVVCPLIRGEEFTLDALADVFTAAYQGRDDQFGPI
jgi:hypothetical protein